MTTPPIYRPNLPTGTAPGTAAEFRQIGEVSRRVNERVAAVETDKLDKAGGMMTGPLLLPADPTAALQAATKQYVDAGDATKPAVPVNASGVGQWVSLIGATGGSLALPAGGTWAWAVVAWNQTTVPAGTLANTLAGVDAGGATLAGVPGIQFRGFAWRIA